jgi:hypothetical protein
VDHEIARAFTADTATRPLNGLRSAVSVPEEVVDWGGLGRLLATCPQFMWIALWMTGLDCPQSNCHQGLPPALKIAAIAR